MPRARPVRGCARGFCGMLGLVRPPPPSGALRGLSPAPPPAGSGGFGPRPPAWPAPLRRVGPRPGSVGLGLSARGLARRRGASLPPAGPPPPPLAPLRVGAAVGPASLAPPARLGLQRVPPSRPGPCGAAAGFALAPPPPRGGPVGGCAAFCPRAAGLRRPQNRRAYSYGLHSGTHQSRPLRAASGGGRAASLDSCAPACSRSVSELRGGPRYSPH